MESMSYITKQDLGLTRILEIALERTYKSKLIYDGYEQLNIRFGEDKSEWWKWFKIKENEMAFDDDEDYQKLRELAPQSIFVIEYHPNTLPILADFLKLILLQYGGSVGCRGSIKETYTVENIDMLISGCP